MTKFKAGDKIRLINDTGMAAKVGATATVIEDHHLRNHLVRVTWDRNDLSGRQQDGGYSPSEFELVEETPKTKNPCIIPPSTTPQLIDAQLDIGAGYFNITFPDQSTFEFKGGGHLSNKELKKLARQLGEIADAMKDEDK